MLSRVQFSAIPWLLPTRLLCSWNSPGKNTVVGCRSHLQGIFPIQGLNLALLNCRQIFFTIWATREAHWGQGGGKAGNYRSSLKLQAEGTLKLFWCAGIFMKQFLFRKTVTQWETLLLLLSRFSRVWLKRPHGLQPSRLLHPWDSPGKNTGVCCHFPLQCRKVESERKSLSPVRLLATPWTAAYQAPPSMGFSRQQYWSGVSSLKVVHVSLATDSELVGGPVVSAGLKCPAH